MSATITLTITEDDFDQLINTSMKWGKEWVKNKGRFTNAPLFTWKMAYWCDNYVAVLICQHYLSSRGYESQTVFDTATQEHLILTNFVSAEWEDGE